MKINIIKAGPIIELEMGKDGIKSAIIAFHGGKYGSEMYILLRGEVIRMSAYRMFLAKYNANKRIWEERNIRREEWYL